MRRVAVEIRGGDDPCVDPSRSLDRASALARALRLIARRVDSATRQIGGVLLRSELARNRDLPDNQPALPSRSPPRYPARAVVLVVRLSSKAASDVRTPTTGPRRP